MQGGGGHHSKMLQLSSETKHLLIRTLIHSFSAKFALLAMNAYNDNIIILYTYRII